MTITEHWDNVRKHQQQIGDDPLLNVSSETVAIMCSGVVLTEILMVLLKISEKLDKLGWDGR